MKKIIKFTCIILSVILAGIYTIIGLGQIFLPKEITVYNDFKSPQIMKVFTVTAGNAPVVTASSAGSVKINDAEVKLFGLFPVSNIKTVESERRHVRVSGELIGIRLYTEGLLVVGLDEVITNNGQVCPGKESGIAVGDVITSINGKGVTTIADFIKEINSLSGKSFELTVNRKNESLSLTMLPVYSDTDGKYRCGLWLRDSTAGIGTMTFFDEQTGMMAALGHAICDTETESVLSVGSGDVLSADLTGVTQGVKGATGQLMGSFTEKVLGQLYENNDFGIYGSYTCSLSDESTLLYPVAGETEVELGKAQIISTVNGNGPEFYDIEIEKITYSDKSAMRNLVIKVTDKELISETGGIVQGMSGSPIIQNDMLVGAVTHVFLNDPTQGYGIFAEKMICEEERISAER